MKVEDPGCVSRGTVQHEFLHALGFGHEQVRGDRDEYIKVYKENVETGNWFNYEKLGSEVCTNSSSSLSSSYGSIHIREITLFEFYISFFW